MRPLLSQLEAAVQPLVAKASSRVPLHWQIRGSHALQVARQRLPQPAGAGVPGNPVAAGV